jgi:hypothetical protein
LAAQKNFIASFSNYFILFYFFSFFLSLMQVKVGDPLLLPLSHLFIQYSG